MANSKLVTGIARTRDEADAAIRRMVHRGTKLEAVSLLVEGEARWHRLVLENVARVVAGAGVSSPGGALGAAVAAITGTGTSVLLRSAALVVAGPMALSLLDAASEDIPLVDALVMTGVPASRAGLYETCLREGDTIIGVHARTEQEAAQLGRILDDFGPDYIQTAHFQRHMLDSFI